MRPLTPLPALVLAVAAGAGLWPAAAAEQASILFLHPRHNATVLGADEIELLLLLPEGVRAVRIELHVDGRPLGVLSSPPWKQAWNAGDGSAGHRIEAVAMLSDGTRVRETIRTSPLRVNLVEQVDLVNLYLVVRDGAGDYVTDLERRDFEIRENGRPQGIERFSTTHKPLRVGIVLDSSLSMEKGDRLDKAKRAALQFLDILQADDEGLVVTFSDEVRVERELTADRTLLASAIERAVAGGGTALYDALWRTARLLEGFDGRRVLVLLSDGRDESANGFEPGSLHTLEEALEQALRSEVMVFPIGLGRHLDEEYVRRWGRLGGLSNLDTDTTLLDVLRRMADATGGRAVVSQSPGSLRKAFEDIAEDLRNQYSLAYVSDDPQRDGKWRRIEVLTPGRTLSVVTRKGYYAPRENDRNARH